MKWKKCEDPRCKYSKDVKKCYLHSTKLYYKKLAKKKTYYWACISCVNEDHKLWEKDNKDKHNKIEKGVKTFKKKLIYIK